METIGTVKIEHSVEWVIPNFFSLSEEAGKYYCSDTFFFNGSSMYLKIFPNGDEEHGSIGFVDLVLVRISSDSQFRLYVSFNLKNSSGEKEVESDYGYMTDEDCYSLISRIELSERKLELLLDDALTVGCILKCPESTENANCTRVCQDFKEMLLDGQNHDLIFKVGDKELRAHRDVLSARSLVFKSLLSHDMKEKESGVIDIPDCDPKAMEQFLFYIYCGKVDTLEESNMCNLYYIADKYDIKELKEECSVFMRKTLSIINICEITQLALKHADSSLLECIAEYLKDNMLDIMRTVELKSFMEDNFTATYELLIKSIEKLYNVRT